MVFLYQTEFVKSDNVMYLVTLFVITLRGVRCKFKSIVNDDFVVEFFMVKKPSFQVLWQAFSNWNNSSLHIFDSLPTVIKHVLKQKRSEERWHFVISYFSSNITGEKRTFLDVPSTILIFSWITNQVSWNSVTLIKGQCIKNIFEYIKF